ncbi:hypothetical protein chiPu_0017019 [Chiloscyllium punctatum]|uniref:Uncharacterized protein n=1 Tax=Chiloscyllium punctatum TaxID=137246 RepID=A0A401T7A4_CHIPU|nr:hypothetical protein [Chiloscyllium punctatum]
MQFHGHAAFYGAEGHPPGDISKENVPEKLEKTDIPRIPRTSSLEKAGVNCSDTGEVGGEFEKMRSFLERQKSESKRERERERASRELQGKAE